MRARFTPTAGFTLVEISIVMLIIGLLAAVAMPNLVRARQRAQQRVCRQNLTAIAGAKDRWAIENKKKTGDTTVTAEVNSYFKNSRAPACPCLGTYTYRPVGQNPTCSRGAALGHTL